MKSLERLLSSSSSSNSEVIEEALRTLDNLIALNPTPHRPLLPTLLPLLHTLLLSPPSPNPLPASTKRTLTGLLSRLHTLSGKTSSAGTFKGDLEGMMREASWVLDGLGEEVWVGGIGGSAGSGRGNARPGMGASISGSQPLVLGQLSSQVPGLVPGQKTNGGMTVIGDKSARLDLRLNGWARCLDGWVEGIVGMLRYVPLLSFPIFRSSNRGSDE